MRIARRLSVTLVATALLAGPAGAKEVTKVELCGPDRCASVTGDPANRATGLSAGYPTDAPRASRWYWVRITVTFGPDEGTRPDRYRVAWVPGADVVRLREPDTGVLWTTVPDATNRALEQAARSLPAFPAATLRGLGVLRPAARSAGPPSKTPQPPSAARPEADAGRPAGDWIVLGLLVAAGVAGALVAGARLRQGAPPTGVTR